MCRKLIDKCEFALVEKKINKSISISRNRNIFAPENGLVAQLNSALDYGSRGYRFESCRGH